MMTKIQFESGTGIYFNAGVNYMTGENDDVSIYAEIAVPENTTEDFGYITMKNAINTDRRKPVFFYALFCRYDPSHISGGNLSTEPPESTQDARRTI